MIKNIDFVQELYDGAREELEKHGKEPITVECGFGFRELSEVNGYRYGHELFKRGNLLDAYIVPNAEFAVGICQALQENGVSIPDQTGIVGCNYAAAGSLAEQKVTVVSRMHEKIGGLAAELLFKIINDKKMAVQKLIVEPELIIRRSTQKN